jgi:hypothetical protein
MSYSWSAGSGNVTKAANSIIGSIFIGLAVIAILGTILWVVFFRGLSSVIKTARRPKAGSPQFEIEAKF